MTYFSGLEDAKLVVNVFSRNKERFGPFASFLAQVMAPSDSLDAGAREAIALHVSAINNCHYCIGSHRAVLLELGYSQNEISEVEAGRSSDPRLTALLRFAGDLTTQPDGTTAEAIASLRAAGASDDDIEATIALAAAFAFMNRLVDGYGIKGDAAAFEIVGKSVVAQGYGAVAGALGMKTEVGDGGRK